MDRPIPPTPPSRLRLAFMGTPDFAVPALAALLKAGHEIAAVYSQPPRPAGRGHRLQPSPVHAYAEAQGIAVRTPMDFKEPESRASFAALSLDAAVIAAYGLLLPDAVLNAPRLGCLNVHASLLPRWRGAAPIQRAILAGDVETGVTIMQMERGLDTGGMLLAGPVPITAETTAETLHDALAALGAKLILKVLDGVAAGTLHPRPQPEAGVTYAAKLTREETRLDWALPAARLERAVRAFYPHPGAWFQREGERVKVLAAAVEPLDAIVEPGTVIDDRLGIATGEGLFRPLRLQRAGRGTLDAEAFLRGQPVPRGTVLPRSSPRPSPQCPATS